MRDPYKVLGVGRTAGDADIKRAYRKLAKELHPDMHPDDDAVAERFKEVSAAYHILSDKDLRAKYDRGEIGADGNQKSSFRYEYAGGGADGTEGFGGFGFGAGNAEDIINEFFGNMRGRAGARRGRRQQQRQQQDQRGDDRSYKITVDFLDAAQGTTRRISLPDGRTLDVKIPPGIEEGKQIRLKGQGDAGLAGGPAGDALIEVAIRPHDRFRREDRDIHLDLPISLPEAVLGAKIEVPTIDGPVSLTIPKGANTGRKLRLKGRGIARGKDAARGDQYVHLQVVLPAGTDAELEAFVEQWAVKNRYDPRG